jgi:kynurenine formamidase
MLDYDALWKRTDAPKGSAWGLHGPDDQIGTLNFLTERCTSEAAKLVTSGQTFNLDCTLDAFDLSHRHSPQHVVLGNERHFTRDDYLDGFYPQGGTQVDGLRHFRHPEHGFYNHTAQEDVVAGTPAIGVQHYAEKAIAGRGVLLDLPRYLAKQGKTLDLASNTGFGPDLLNAVAADQNVTFQSGDILLIRTGWLDAYFNHFDADHRAVLAKKTIAPGLEQRFTSLAWLWNNQFSVIASDTPGFEAAPAVAGSPFGELLKDIPNVPGVLGNMMHPHLIALLGFCVGELWNLEKLADACAADGRYAFMVTVKPLNLVGGVGSPANAIAIK